MTGVIPCGWDHHGKVAQKTVGPSKCLHHTLMVHLLGSHVFCYLFCYIKEDSQVILRFCLVCPYCDSIPKSYAFYRQHVSLSMQKQTKLNRIFELLENLLLCNRISNKKTKKTHGILMGGPSKCDVITLTFQLFFLQPSCGVPVHIHMK